MQVMEDENQVSRIQQELTQAIGEVLNPDEAVSKLLISPSDWQNSQRSKVSSSVVVNSSSNRNSLIKQHNTASGVDENLLLNEMDMEINSKSIVVRTEADGDADCCKQKLPKRIMKK